MSSPRTSFKTVIWLITNLVEDVGDLEERLLSSLCPIPEGLYETATAIVKHCNERVQRAKNFRRQHRRNAAVRFFDWIAIWLGIGGIDQIYQHEIQLEDCGKAVELAARTIKALQVLPYASF
jgi:hypothetical protein